MTFEKSSGNVFADIGFPNPDREQLKPYLTLQIYRIIKSRGLTQAEAGAILGIKQPHVSALMRNRSGNFLVERLMDFSLHSVKTLRSPSGRLAKNTVRYRFSLLEFANRPAVVDHQRQMSQVKTRPFTSCCLNSRIVPLSWIINGKCHK